MKVLLINDGTSSPNWGDRAAGFALRAMVSERGGDIIHTISEDDLYRSSLDGDRGASVQQGERNTREIAKLFIPPLVLKLRRKLFPNVDRTREFAFIPGRWDDYGACAARVLGRKAPWPKLMQSLEEIDLAVVNGTGGIKGNRVLPRTLLFLSYVIKKNFNKPVIMINHTADFNHADLLRVAEEVYPLYDDVVFRDQVSLERCKTLCGGRFAADTAFWFKPALPKAWTSMTARPTYFDFWPDEARFDPSERYLCVGGSSMFGRTKELGGFVDGYTQLVEHLRSLYSGRIVLTASDTIDQTVFRPIARRLGIPLIGVATPVQQAFDVLGNADAYIGGRWHQGVFALRGGTPVIALSSKTFKMSALTDMAGLPSATFDAFDLEKEAGPIGRRLLSLLEKGEGLRSRLRSWGEDMAESSWGNVAYLRRLEARAETTENGGA